MGMNVNSIDQPLIFKTEVGATYTYYGEAYPGSSVAGATWRISRKTNADSTILYANGGKFTATWNNRASESYS